jgi:hypothetical protein
VRRRNDMSSIEEKARWLKDNLHFSIDSIECFSVVKCRPNKGKSGFEGQNDHPAN